MVSIQASDMVKQITDGYSTHTDDYDNILEKLFHDEKKEKETKDKWKYG